MHNIRLQARQASFGRRGLDALHVPMFSLVIPALMTAFGIYKADAGLRGSVTLFFSAFGGWLGGALSDRFGRVRALHAKAASSRPETAANS